MRCNADMLDQSCLCFISLDTLQKNVFIVRSDTFQKNVFSVRSDTFQKKVFSVRSINQDTF